MSSADSSFLQAASEGDLEKVKNLLDKHKLDINLRGPMNRTALHLAALYGKMDVVIFLVEKKASLDLQASSGEGFTPFSLQLIY